MPPRSRTKPGSTNRRPKVAGLRQHAHVGAGAPPVDDVDAPELEDRFDAAVESPAEAPATTPAEDTAVDTAEPGASTGAGATEADAPADEAAAEPDEATARAVTTALPTPATEDVDEIDETATDDAETTDAVDNDDAKSTVATTVTAPRTNRARRGTRMTPRAVPAEDVETARPTRAAKPTRVRKAETEAEPRRFVRQREALGRFAGSKAVPITLVVAIVVCLVLGGLAFWKGREAWTTGPVSNGAVVDVGGTAELVGQSRESIEKIFSYDFGKLDDSVEAARTMSTGEFTNRYLSVFDQTIRQPAQQQQLRQTATVVNIGVTEMRGDRATVMALTQFSAQRTTTGQSTNAPGLLRLDMERVDGRWKLAELTPLTANR